MCCKTFGVLLSRRLTNFKVPPFFSFFFVLFFFFFFFFFFVLRACLHNLRVRSFEPVHFFFFLKKRKNEKKTKRTETTIDRVPFAIPDIWVKELHPLWKRVLSDIFILLLLL
eukprot:TRINITY_DN13220_c3_g1_i1.p2 TRINITY_DN13220_c3_g1~~TRINITY_DN13220_c3_g1_i1.p2  ORF type:complete len:112 (+),score=6.48 TRINITY_DN13220_c3_g1_i1:140-475(+)